MCRLICLTLLLVLVTFSIGPSLALSQEGEPPREREEVEKPPEGITEETPVEETAEQPAEEPAEEPLEEELPSEFEGFADESLLFKKIPKVYVATRKEMLLTEVPSTVTVVTSEDIERSGARTLSDVLRMVPGLEVMRMSSTESNVSARGFNQSTAVAQGILVLIDGRQEYSDFFGAVIWEDLPIALEEIERIEVIRGPGSFLYGPYAMHGVVNIITKSPKSLGDRTLVAGTYGTYSTEIGTLSRSGIAGDLAYKLTVGGNDINQFYDRDENIKGQWFGSVRLDYDLSEESQLTFSTGITDSEGEVASLSPIGRKGYRSHAMLEYDRGPLRSHLYWNRADQDAEALFLPVEYEVTTDNYDLEFQYAIPFMENHEATLGLGMRYNECDSDALDDDHTQTLFWLFAQDEYALLENLTLTNGLRFDRHPVSGQSWCPRSSLVYTPWENHTFRLSAAKGIRQPSFYESYVNATLVFGVPSIDLPMGAPPPPFDGYFLGSQEDPVNGYYQSALVEGNDDLDVEKLNSLELGYSTSAFERIRLNVDLFYNEADDLIRFEAERNVTADDVFPYISGSVDPIPGPPNEGQMADAQIVAALLNASLEANGLATRWYPRNADDRYVFGGELSFDYLAAENIKLFGNYSCQKSIDQNGHEEVKSAPRHKGNLGVRAKLSAGFFISLWANAVGHTEFTDGPVSSYVLVNGKVGYRFWEDRAEVYISGMNLLDDDHSEFPETNARGWRNADEYGRIVYFGFSYQF